MKAKRSMKPVWPRVEMTPPSRRGRALGTSFKTRPISAMFKGPVIRRSGSIGSAARGGARSWLRQDHTRPSADRPLPRELSPPARARLRRSGGRAPTRGRGRPPPAPQGPRVRRRGGSPGRSHGFRGTPPPQAGSVTTSALARLPANLGRLGAAPDPGRPRSYRDD